MRFFSTVTIGVLMTATPYLSGGPRRSPAGDVAAPQTTADMQTLIKALSGHWSVKVKLEPSREAPGGIEGAGDETWHAGPDGLTFTDEEVFALGPQTVRIIGFLWQDRKTKDFHALDCSNQNPDTCDLKGAMDDVVVHWTGSELTIDEREVSAAGKGDDLPRSLVRHHRQFLQRDWIPRFPRRPVREGHDHSCDPRCDQIEQGME